MAISSHLLRSTGCWLAADLLSDELAVLRRVLAPTSLLRADAELSPLLAAIRDTRRGQGKLSAALGENVRRAVETLLRSRQPLVGPVWEDHKGADLYVAACHFVMRLVVTLFAEARELLPVDNPVYYQAYGLRGLLDQLDRLTPERRKARQMAWPRLLALFRLLYQGSPHPAVTLPAYGGDLFRPGDHIARAISWGRRAVEVGKLVKKPRSLTAEARAGWAAQLDAAARQVVADVKLPGELYLVRWGGTRKGAGTFYSAPGRGRVNGALPDCRVSRNFVAVGIECAAAA